MDDAPAMAAIKNAWVDESDWLPRIHPASDLERHYREGVIPNRETHVIGEPIEGFIALDREEKFVTSLFCRTKGAGYGKRLLDHAKASKFDELNLWSFVANTRACKFYEREGFIEIDRSEGDNEEGLPDILFRWKKPEARIRDAAISDLPACSEIINKYIDETEWLPRTTSEKEIAALFTAELVEKRKIFVAECDGKIVGYLSLHVPKSFLQALYIQAEFQCQQLGKRFLDKAKSEMPTGFELTVFEHNERARKFYEREKLIEVPDKYREASQTPENIGQITMRWEGKE